MKIYSSEEKDLIKHNDKVNKMHQKINYFMNYDLELNLLSMKIGVKDDIKDKLFNVVQDSYSIDIEFASINDESPTIKHILQKEKYWSCICGEMVNFLLN